MGKSGERLIKAAQEARDMIQQEPGVEVSEGKASIVAPPTPEDVEQIVQEAHASQATEDAAQLAAHEGPAMYEREWNLCLSLAFQGQAINMLTDWGSVPFCMADFIRNNPAAPEAAVLIHVRRTEKVVILPNEDQRRVLLAVALLRLHLVGQDAIDKEHAEALRQQAEREANATAPRLVPDLRGTAFEVELGPFDQLSDTARSI